MARKKIKTGALLFGTAGVPPSSSKSDPASGVEAAARLGLSAMELEFVYGVRITDEMAERVRERAATLGIVLTCHGPYYINLNSKEPEKRAASIKRILDTARAAHKVGAHSITFHAAFYLKEDPYAVHQVVKDSLERIMETLDAEGIRVQVRPELTGKPSQYGDLGELLALATEIEGVLPCIDFSHLHARAGGGMNTLEEYRGVLRSYADALGEESLADLHLHISGIDYGPKGERKHLQLDQSDLNWRDLLISLKEASASGVVICESPNTEKDALKMQRFIRRLKV
ncbi:MAG TPA: TIM barrel protein [Myxococcota bacterium]|nr:TIM barrel protein [Myxococcota bacterium]